MNNDALLQIVLQARDEASNTIKGVGGALDGVSNQSANFSAAFKAAGGVMLGVGIAGVAMMKSWVDAAKANQVAMASVDTTLKIVATTTEKNGDDFYQLKKITDEVSDSYVRLGFSDNETAKAFASDLRITKDVTDAKFMLTAATDLARLKNEDLVTASQQVTLAYEGNMRVLKQLGIEVTKGAKGMEVINEIEKAAGGQAQAFANTFEGATQILSAQIEQLKQKLGDRLLPTITQFVTSIGNVIDKLNSLSPAAYDAIVNVTKFGTAFALIAAPILLFIGFLPAIGAGLTAISGIALPLVLILAGLAIGAYLLYTHWQQIAPILNEVKTAIVDFVKNAVKQITDFYIKNKATFDAFFTEVKLIFQFALAFISALWKTVWGTIKDILIDIWEVIKGVVQTAWGIVQLIIGVGLGILTGNWTKAWGIIKDSFKNIWDGIKEIAKGAMNAIVNSVVLMINLVIGLINGFISGINSLTKSIPNGSKFQIGTIQPLSVPSFDIGGYVPKTGLALVHEGEFVLSRDMLSGKQNTPQTINRITNANQPITIYANINEDMDLSLMANKLAFALRNSR